MADIAQIQADVAELQQAEAAAADELAALADQVAQLEAGTPVTQEQLDNLHSSLAGVTTSLKTSVASAQGAQVNPLDQ